MEPPSRATLLPFSSELSSRMWQALIGARIWSPPRTSASPPPLVSFAAFTSLEHDEDLSWPLSWPHELWWPSWPPWPPSLGSSPAKAAPVMEPRPTPMIAVASTVLRIIDTIVTPGVPGIPGPHVRGPSCHDRPNGLPDRGSRLPALLHSFERIPT